MKIVSESACAVRLTARPRSHFGYLRSARVKFVPCHILFVLFTCFCFCQTAGKSVGQERATGQETELQTVREAKLAARLQELLDAFVKEEAVPGATLSVAMDGGKTIDLASGFADPADKTEMTHQSRMFCGSTGKTFVAAVALRLIDQGKLELDAPVARYFDSDEEREWFEQLPNASDLTIRTLMNHTSGLPRYLFQPKFLDDLKADPMRSRTPREGLEALFGADPVHACGKGWFYSDSNFLLLGIVIEKVSGKKFYDLAQQQLLDPLGLKDTIPARQPELPGLVQGRIGSDNFFDLPARTVREGKYVMNPDFEWCGGGFVTTAHDLAVWLQALHSTKIVSAELHEQMVSPLSFQNGEPAEAGYGLGSFVWQSPHGAFYGHAGIMPGYLTQIEFSADYKFAIALQTNSDEGLGRSHHMWVQRFADVIIKQMD